jgi:hypothetical protein
MSETEQRERSAVDPAHIMQIGMGFMASKTLLSAVELELFTKLGAEGMTGEQLAEALRPRIRPGRACAATASGRSGCRRLR